MKKSPLQTLLAAAAILGCDGEDKPRCRVCDGEHDLVFDDDGETVCCDCLFEEETYDANQP